MKISKLLGKEKRNGSILSSNEAVICLDYKVNYTNIILCHFCLQSQKGVYAFSGIN